MIIAVKQCGGYTTHCQLHGEPTEHPPYTHVKFNVEGGKVAHMNLHENALNIQVLEAIGLMGFDIDKFEYEFVRWENFSLLNKAPVSGNANDFEKELLKLINAYATAGLSKTDLVHKMQYVTKSCEVS